MTWPGWLLKINGKSWPALPQQIVSLHNRSATMSSIKVSTPSNDEIKQHPREFALLTQIPGYEAGSINSSVSPFAPLYEHEWWMMRDTRLLFSLCVFYRRTLTFPICLCILSEKRRAGPGTVFRKVRNRQCCPHQEWWLFLTPLVRMLRMPVSLPSRLACKPSSSTAEAWRDTLKTLSQRQARLRSSFRSPAPFRLVTHG